MIDWNATDGLAFDMDGTLWDAVDSYSEIWNVCFRRYGVRRTVERADVEACMGLPNGEILRRLAGDALTVGAEEMLAAVGAEEERMMPRLGGRAYPGVADGLRQLAELYPVFLVSNCGATGLDNMMDWLGVRPAVTAAYSYGATLRPKHENLRLIADGRGLRQLVYVGDTEGDCRETRLAGLPFVHAAYGFGLCAEPDMSVGSFQELVDFFVNIKKENSDE